jgi:hypothetical protein
MRLRAFAALSCAERRRAAARANAARHVTDLVVPQCCDQFRRDGIAIGFSLLKEVHGGDTEEGAQRGQASSAKAVCGRCEVDKNCLSYALETMPHGI